MRQHPLPVPRISTVSPGFTKPPGALSLISLMNIPFDPPRWFAQKLAELPQLRE